MRTGYRVVCVVVAAALLGVARHAGAEASSARAAFGKLKELAGDWQGTYGGRSRARASYRVVSGGSAIVETLTEGGEPDMVTVYHLDGDTPMLTHYCSVGNQPRMVAVPDSDAREITFTFKDITNLSAPSDGHMRGLTITFVDDNHFTQEWTWHENGKDYKGAVFRFERVR